MAAIGGEPSSGQNKQLPARASQPSAATAAHPGRFVDVGEPNQNPVRAANREEAVAAVFPPERPVGLQIERESPAVLQIPTVALSRDDDARCRGRLRRRGHREAADEAGKTLGCRACETGWGGCFQGEERGDRNSFAFEDTLEEVV
jgi:hypothetical protein